ncbi:NifB/NifX family molybdenum-iron cluster-binding protein [Candidatus Methylobacter oryzae]|uniref:Vanadium nitrogenase n=1 Tax=Candidatus Methylobacter oryzae TaxID=2497749 RepID=A0ABY3C4J1_9GAMM|nr:NifB/NifX family molybdenum-iron cluster-binding protein [Candidatus Methylobacter oryzae]TRW89625.1 vanadium nitrogenase [Candidatus Methylobacter oryzae]
MIKVAFASSDQTHVNLHFGAAERFVIYQVAPGQAELVAVGEFVPAVMTGDNRFKDAPFDPNAFIMDEVSTHPDAVPMSHEDKVASKLEFLTGCAAVYAASIGASSIKRIMAAGIQPIIVNTGSAILDHLNEISIALTKGGLAWVEKAKAQSKPANRFDAIAEQGWNGDEPGSSAPQNAPSVTIQ